MLPRNLAFLASVLLATACMGAKDSGEDTGSSGPPDIDGDGVIDGADNCVGEANTDQSDVDGDSIGDVCDVDADGDGYEGDVDDCDDLDATVNPDATELCDEVDNNCDGDIDEDSAADGLTWYADTDGDGYGDAESTTTACNLPSGYSADATDCDDAVDSTYPDADEYCDDIDNNCDGDIDEDASVDAMSWHTDVDGDGYGDPNDYVNSCTEVSGYLADGSDNCPDVANADQADLDADAIGDICDGDVDGDGYEAAVDDCDDWDAASNPGATEVCDEADNDCDGLVDDDDDSVDLSNSPSWYADNDLDGYGDATWTSSAQSCSAPDPEAEAGSNAPAATVEYDAPVSHTISLAGCGTVGGVTVDVDYTTDTLGYLEISLTSPTGTTLALKSSTSNWDDDWAGTYSDDESDLTPVDDLSTFAGEDSTGDWTLESSYSYNYYGATLNSWGVNVVCLEWVGDDTDCDDADADVGGPTDWYTDADGDGYGDAATAVASCDQVSGTIADGTDCDDTDSAVGGPDTYYADTDGDGYGDTSTSTTDCSGAPSGYTSDDGDCDDTDSTVGMANPAYDVDAGSATGDAVASGVTTGMGDDYNLGDNCSFYGSSAEDVAILWTAPADGTYAFDVFNSDFDTSLGILDGCDESELACDGDYWGYSNDYTSCVEYTVTAGMTYVIVVDAYSSSYSGNYQLDILDTATEGSICP